jgi:hypothetical protein
VLDELERRLLAERSCDGACVVVSRADFKVEGLQVTLQAEVHAQRDAAWFLPGPVDTLRLDEVRVDGQTTRQLRREPGGLTAVRLAAGRHSVELQGTLVNRDVVTIQFDADTRPHLVTFTSEGWGVDGIKSTGVPDNSLQLTRRAAGGEPGEGAELSAELPPWFRVTRRFALGLPWQVITEVERENSERPQLVKIPLVSGEKLITDGFRIEEGKVLVDFPRGVQSVAWTSELDVTPALVITAADAEQPWTEDWTVDCSRIWRCTFDGLVPVSSSSNGTSWLPLWKPWPGEQLKVSVERPEGAPGQAATVDNVRYTATPGKRLLQAKVELSIRASQGSWQRLQLPDGAELQELKIDGKAQTIRPEGSILNIPVRPGAQRIELSWQQPWDRTFFEEMPKLSLGSSAVNGNMTIILGEDRWLLWAVGPSWGPAVLFWSHLALLLIAAFLLSRVKNSPLKIWEWLLLAIGMAQLPVPLVLFPVAWFFILAWRKRAPLTTWWHFDLLQIGIVLLTLIAVGVSYGAIHTNLLFDVDMQVRGAGSSNGVLNWYVDQIDDVLPAAGILSLPLLVWRILMLLWALWLVSRLLKWAPWSWRAFSEGGLWRVIPPSPPRLQPQSYRGGPGGASPWPPEAHKTLWMSIICMQIMDIQRVLCASGGQGEAPLDPSPPAPARRSARAPGMSARSSAGPGAQMGASNASSRTMIKIRSLTCARTPPGATTGARTPSPAPTSPTTAKTASACPPPRLGATPASSTSTPRAASPASSTTKTTTARARSPRSSSTTPKDASSKSRSTRAPTAPSITTSGTASTTKASTRTGRTTTTPTATRPASPTGVQGELPPGRRRHTKREQKMIFIYKNHLLLPFCVPPAAGGSSPRPPLGALPYDGGLADAVRGQRAGRTSGGCDTWPCHGAAAFHFATCLRCTSGTSPRRGL